MSDHNASATVPKTTRPPSHSRQTVRHPATKSLMSIGGGLLGVIGLFFISQWNYLLFHTLVETGAVAVAWSVFLLIWNARRLKAPPHFVMLGVGYLFVGGLDLLHTLAYEGMEIIGHQGANLAAQLWLAARSIEAAALLLFPFCISRPSLARWGGGILAAGSGFLLGSVFLWEWFPVCYEAATGLTAFKKGSEYVLMGAFALAALLTWPKRAAVGERIAPLLVASMLVTVASEFTFTLYASPYGMANIFGHLLKVISFGLLFRALMAEGVERPLEVLGRDLQEETRRYTSIIKTARDGFWLIDLAGNILDVNDAATQMLGYSREQLLSMTVNDIEMIESREETARRIQKMRRDGHGLFESKHRRSDGSILDVEISCSYVPGARPSLVAFIRDISNRKQSEADLRYQAAIFRQVSDAIIATDMNRRITSWNSAAELIYGWSAPEAIGKDEDALLQTQYLDQRFEEAQDILMQTGAWKGEVRQKSKDGRDRIIEASISWIQDADGAIVGGVTANRDMTERREAQQLLALSEERYRHIVETAQEGIWILDGRGMTTYVNERMAAMLGYDEEAMQGRPFLDFMAPEDISLAEYYLKRRHEGIREQHDFRFRRSDGSAVWTLVSTNPWMDENGEMAGVLGMVIDITARKRMEEALRVSEEHYRSIVSVLPDLLFRINSELRFTDVQTTAPEMLLAPTEHIIGRSIWDILPEDVAKLTLEKVKHALCAGAIQIYHYALDVHDQRRECETRMIPCGDGEVLAIVRDVTESRQAEHHLRQSEARYLSVVNDQTELICRFTEDGVLTFVNDAYCRYFSQTPANLLGRSFSPMVPDEDMEVVNKQIASLSRENPIVHYEHRVIRADGSIGWLEWTDRSIYDKIGHFVEYQAVGRDITERRQLQNRLMEASEREQKRLAQELHDGLCQDLKSLEIEAALLEDAVAGIDAPAAARAAQIGQRINEAVRTAYSIVRGMLPAGLDAAGFSTALANLIAHARTQSPALIDATIEDDLRPDTGPQAYHLYRIAQEAIGNALRHAQASRLVVRWVKDGERILLAVEDDGIGWAESEAVRSNGGMGLLVMRSRAQAIGATFEIRSADEGGTEVRCVLRATSSDGTTGTETESDQ